MNVYHKFALAGSLPLRILSKTPALILTPVRCVPRLESNRSEFFVISKEIVVAPSPVYVLPIKNALEGTGVSVAAQTAYKGQQGAFTGEVS